MSDPRYAVSTRKPIHFAYWIVFIASLVPAAFPTTLNAEDVDLALVAVTPVVAQGDTVDVELRATIPGGTSQDIVGLDAILDWDPAILELQGIVAGAGHSWFVTDFLDDPDGINVDLTDGDALYTALTSPGMPVAASTSPGLHIATFRFTALAETVGTDVSLVATAGTFATTQVLYLFAEDVTGDIGTAATITVGIPEEGFQRADANADSLVNIADPIWVLNYLFQAGLAPPCLKAGDSNDDGSIDVSDPIYTISWLFTDGPEPPPPFLSCGTDPTPDALDCLDYPPCP